MRVGLAVCIAAITFTCGAAQAQPDRMDTITIPDAAAALTELWTEQRMRDAQPVPLPVIERRAIGSDSLAEPPSLAVPSEILPGQVSSVSGDVRAKPLFWAGKLFIAISETTIGFCSAQLVAPDVVITAAHCIRNEKTGEWHDRVVYRHQYDHGKGRIFAIRCIASYNGWVSTDSTRFAWDFAMIKLRGSSDQGYFGLEYGWRGKYNRAPKIGYPMEIEKGEVIQVEFGPLIKGWSPYVVGLNHGNPQNTGGSSGGAWVGAYDPNATNPRANVVITVESHYVNDQPRTSYGPYWDQKMVRLLDKTKRDCQS